MHTAVLWMPCEGVILAQKKNIVVALRCGLCDGVVKEAGKWILLFFW